MRLGSVAILLLLSSLLSLPVVAAQAPPLPPVPPVPEPDPSDALALACATLGGPAPDVRDALPVCPRVDPAGPAPADERHAHDPAPVPGAPQDVAQLAGDVLDDVRKIPEDPTTAPERLAAIVATVLQFLRDLLGLPLQGLDAVGAVIERALDGIGEAIVDGGRAVAEAAATARDTVACGIDAAKQGVGDLAATIRAIFDPLTPEPPVATPSARDAQRDVRDAADGLLQTARGEVRQVLADGP